MPNYDFTKDLPKAQKTERQIATFLEEKGLKYISDCNNSDYDLLMELTDGTRMTIEIKEDFTCEVTGNVGVEYECRGKPSGISVSKADFYCYKVHESASKKGLYIIKTEKLKEMIRKRIWHREVCGGDPGSNSRCYLFYLRDIKSHFKYLGNLSH